ncbi:hypothetical protein SSX86_022838 [Deinandra increscens subsp. villosa]|uniref:F-box domain-containing protein n=1 Tax=Deinandra increscens subsp. villosa TaxID=3103831 RepID=A0AAP0CRC4_9ASTR
MDRISRLPDDVLFHILSFLPTKHAVATSILSSRWVNLWSFLSIIDLDDSLYLDPSRRQHSDPALFINFLHRVLSLNQSKTIVKFRLHMHHTYPQTLPGFNAFIQSVIFRDVVEFDLGVFSNFPLDEDCLMIPNSRSLKVLKVRSEFCLKMPAFPGCFPSLRVFDVKVSLVEGDELIANLFPCLPALEKLCLAGDLTDCTGEIYVNIGGAALKHLDLELLIYNYDECDAMVVIDAPQLDYLRLQDGFLASYLVKNKPAIGEVRLDVGEYEEEFLEYLDEVGPTRLARFDELLNSLVNARFISVSATTIKVIFSQNWNLPVLPYLIKLELDVHAGSWILLLHWLKSCPNLKVLSLIIKEKPVFVFEDLESRGVDAVPSCLSSCVKEIEIKRLGKVDEEEMLKYLLENAKVLDKFTVNSRVYIKDGVLQ